MMFNGFDPDMVVVFGFAFVVVVISLAYGAYQRHLKHKERMAMIEKGIVPTDWEEDDVVPSVRRRGSTSGVTVTLVGVAITLGMLTIGIGPWLIGGLIPTAVGCAMIIQQIIDESKEKRGDDK